MLMLFTMVRPTHIFSRLRLSMLFCSLSLILMSYLPTLLASSALVSTNSGNHASQIRLGHDVNNLKNHLFTRAAKSTPLLATGGSGSEYVLGDGTRAFDASSGAGVSCLGRYDKRVEDAWVEHYRMGVGYVPASLYAQVSEDLAQVLVDSTDGKMLHAEFYGSGKTVRPHQPQTTNSVKGQLRTRQA